MLRRDFLAMLSAGAAAAGKGTLVPAAPGTTPGYWCTWSAQNYSVDARSIELASGMLTHSRAAANLNEESVFGAAGWARAFAPVQRDLYLMFDNGWDVPGGTEFDGARWKLGSHEVAADKFPCCSGSPAERQRRLNERTKQAGWRGAGLWIAAHAHGEGRDGRMLEWPALEQYFRERARWSREAGIDYWKVDYGVRGDARFRKMLTDIGRSEAPRILMEHARPGGPMNDEECPWDVKEYSGRGDFRRWGNGAVLEDCVNLARHSDVFRTYDVTAQLSIPTTLDRAAQVLAAFSERRITGGILNCEDEPYIAAGLGCAMGIMRHPTWIDLLNTGYNPRQLHRRIDEVTRAVRWQRLAPAWAAGSTPVTLDSSRLDDTWRFRKGETWADWVLGRTVVQGAPARVARNCAMPSVAGADLPFVIASRHPETGAVALATLPRAAAGRGFREPQADIRLELDRIPVFIGIFGTLRSLTLITPRPGRIDAAQDLAGDRQVPLASTARGREIRIDGAVLRRVGLSAGTPGDLSEPAAILRVVPA